MMALTRTASKGRHHGGIGRSLVKGAALAAAPAVVAPVASKVVGGVARGRQLAGQATDVIQTASHIKQAVAGETSTLGKVGAVISEVRKIGDGGDRPPKLSHLIEQHTDVAVPRSVAYDQWTQFESFSEIMKGVESASQQSRERVEWAAKIGPSRRTWHTEIVEQVPDERIAWKSTGGAQTRGVVTFHALDDELTRILIEMEYHPAGLVEGVGNLLRVQRRRVKRDLRLFKHFIELRGEPTGAWRGRIAKHDVKQDGREGK